MSGENEPIRKQHALMDWQNELKYQQSVVNSEDSPEDVKERARGRIKEAEKWIAKIQATDKLAVVFPGMGYGKDKPLLYYAARQAKELGYEIRYVDYEGLPPMAGNTREEKVEWTEGAYAKVVKQLADIDWSDKDIVFIAKSVGTVIASQYARANDLKPVMLLLTPLNETFEFICDGKNFVFTGELDPWFDDMKLSNEVRGKIEEEFMYGESDHSLEGSCVDDDLDILRECIRHIRCVLTGEDWED